MGFKHVFLPMILLSFILTSPVFADQCTEPGDYLVCEDWDSGTPPEPWPCRKGEDWNGWHPATYGSTIDPDNPEHCGDIDTKIYRSPPRSLKQHKPRGSKGTVDMKHPIPGNPTKIYVRFYLYFTKELAEAMFATRKCVPHLVFLNTATAAEVELDFKRSSYGWKHFEGNIYLNVHSYNPTVRVTSTIPGVEPFHWDEHTEEWVLVEWMVDFANDRASLWINEKAYVLDYPVDWDYDSATYIIISGFSADGSEPYEFDYYLDDIAISTHYIGPRSGSDKVPPNPPQNVKITKQSNLN